jgi:hypothetical protein
MNAPVTALQTLLMSQDNRLFKLKFPHNDGPQQPGIFREF